MAVHIIGSTLEDLLRQDWLAVNHLGGYASSTPIGLNTRKYHGLLVAPMATPVRRMVLLSRVEETVHAHGNSFPLSASEYTDTIHPRGFEQLVAFDPSPFPRWAFQAGGWTLQKELRSLPQRNAVSLQYTLLGCNSPVTLDLRPMLALRGMHELMYQWGGPRETTPIAPGHLRIDATSRTPEVFLAHDGTFDPQPLWYLNTIYRQEQQRGYAALEDLWTPGMCRWTLSPGRTVHFVCSADPVLLDQAVHEANGSPIVINTQSDPGTAVLTHAAQQFSPVIDSRGIARLVTQYPWSPPSGRDALIALPGLFLSTHRHTEAAAILDSFVLELSGGLMPSAFPEDGSEPLYGGTDVSLWFVHAVDRYLHATSENIAETASEHLPWVNAVDRIVQAYQHGTRLGVHVDHDGLLTSQAAGQATTWMDAKCGDWVVTPRAGRAVEINALWHNAICVASELMRSVCRTARSEELALLAASVRHAFVAQFWDSDRRYCHDVVGDPTLRPNQLLAISLPHPVLPKEHHASVLNAVRHHLLTPVGIRTLDPRDDRYCPQYRGDPVSRDRAQHQGSAYPWLLGAYADAVLRVQGDQPSTRNEIRQLLAGCIRQMQETGLGQLPDLFDGSSPHQPGGAILSARSIGEVLRAYVRTAETSSSNAPIVSQTHPFPV